MPDEIFGKDRFSVHTPIRILISSLHRTLNHHLDKFRARPTECGHERRSHILCLCDTDCLEPESLCNAYKINRRVDKVHTDKMVTLMECQKSLLDNPIATVIHDHNRQWQRQRGRPRRST